MAGSELFATVAAGTRTAIKDSIMPLLCSLVAKGTLATGMAILEPYERLVTIGMYTLPASVLHSGWWNMFVS